RNRSNLGPGLYAASITDGEGCITVVSARITSPEPLNLSLDTTAADCGPTGAIGLTVTGGTPDYTFAWSNGETTEDVTNLPGGIYAVTVTDANGCTATAAATIQDASGISVTGAVTPAACENGGAIDIEVVGGTPAFTFVWSNGDTTEDLANVSAGDYSVTITDAAGCTVSASFTIRSAGSLEASLLPTNVSCAGESTGAIEVVITLGNAVDYEWSNGATSAGLTDIAAGPYSVTITDENGCLTVLRTQVEEAEALNAGAMIVPIGCDTPGSITTDVSGGTPPYSYVWSDGSSADSLTVTDPGNYNLTIRDANGCSLTEAYTVSEVIAVEVASLITGISCNGAMDGGIDLTLTGGVEPFRFQWSNGATTEDIDELGPGSFLVTITDGNGCQTERRYTISEPAALSISCQPADASAPGNNDGRIQITLSGGTPGYRILLTTDAGTDTIPITGSAFTLTDLTAGTYTLDVLDAVGCSASEVCSTEIDAPSCTQSIGDLVTNIEVSPPIGCTYPTGFIRFIGDDLTGYEFSIDSGFTWSVEPLFSELVAGTYATFARSMDGSGCLFTGLPVSVSEAVPVVMDDPSLQMPTACNGADGAITFNAPDSTAPYLFSIDDGVSWRANRIFEGLTSGSYRLAVRDSLSGCELRPPRPFLLDAGGQARLIDVVVREISDCGAADGSILFTGTRLTEDTRIRLNDGPWQDSLSFTGLAAGTYFAELEQPSTGCSFTWNAPLVIGGSLVPSLLDVSVVGVSTCGAEDGSVTISAEGENLEYTFDGGANWQNENILSGQAAGMFVPGVRFADRPECTKYGEGVTIDGGFMALVDSVVTADLLACAGANSGSVTVYGGPGQRYRLNGGDWNTTGIFAELAAGRYELIVGAIDNDCFTVYQEITLSTTGEGAYLADVTAFPADACTNDNGRIVVTPARLDLVFALGDGAFSTETEFSDLIPGDYLLQTRPVSGDCGIDSTLVTVTGILPVVATVDEATPPVCYQGTDGILFASATGGDGTYSFAWRDEAGNTWTGAELNNLPANDYQLIVTDGRACSDTIVTTLAGRADFAAVDAAVNDTAVCSVNEVSFDLGDLNNTLTYVWEQPDGV
ncbi:MAG: SprB repeat-containing protein, partial [Bacteroidota bacterium]